MKLCEKIVTLRKAKGMSQETLAEKLNVSRQAVSRWEVGSAMPDAANLLQISKLFGVTADYLLNEEYSSDQDVPQLREVRKNHNNQILFYLVILEILNLPIQFMTVIVLDRNPFFCILSFVPFLAMIIGFELGYRKRKAQAAKEQLEFRKRFYIISAWLGTYFPVRFLTTLFITFNCGPYSVWIQELTLLTLYICTATLLTLSIEKRDIMKNR